MTGSGGGIVPGPAASILRITTLVSVMCIEQCHGRMDNTSMYVAMSVIIFINALQIAFIAVDCRCGYQLVRSVIFLTPYQAGLSNFHEFMTP